MQKYNSYLSVLNTLIEQNVKGVKMGLGELVAATATIKGIVNEAKAIVKTTERILEEVHGIMKKLREMSEGSFANILAQKVQKLGEVFKILIDALVNIFNAVFNAMDKLKSLDDQGAGNYSVTRI